MELIFSRFARSEPRQRVGTYLRRLLAGRERKNGWTLAENAGAVSPDGMQRLLRTTDWDVDGARDDLRGDVLDQLGDDATGVFILDETRFIKKGVRSAWVQRQYTGTTVAGAWWAIEECFRTAKNEAGLDQCQARSWRAWHSHITLAMLAAAYLAATRAQEAEKGHLGPASTG
ncbi:DDE superfamily endonuclease [Saccharopolyspora shandongensis]|uniref:DDE superfamily endonuclease n=1 Tax=Saccharopolyspora shandongensis TaxID=418495 RepID=A0A1H3U679_9PSEU|nr:DDE superfamily endonuclease [Saccharopolyspora shandongensis]